MNRKQMKLVSFYPLLFHFLSKFEFKPYLIPSPVLYTTSSTRGFFQFAVGANYLSRLFPSCLKPLFQSEAKCKAINMKIIVFLFSCKWNSFSQVSFCTWPYFESESLWNSEMTDSLEIFLKLKIGNAMYSIRIHVVVYDDAKSFEWAVLINVILC